MLDFLYSPNQVHGAESLTSSQSQEILLWNSKSLATTGTYSNPVQIITSCFFKIRLPSFDTKIFQGTLFLSSLPIKIFHALLMSSICATCPIHLILLHLMTIRKQCNIVNARPRHTSHHAGLTIHKFIVMQSSPDSHYFHSPRYKYSPQRPYSIFFLSVERPCFTPIQSNM
jgi:hypothetical protein